MRARTFLQSMHPTVMSSAFVACIIACSASGARSAEGSVALSDEIESFSRMPHGMHGRMPPRQEGIFRRMRTNRVEYVPKIQQYVQERLSSKQFGHAGLGIELLDRLGVSTESNRIELILTVAAEKQATRTQGKEAADLDHAVDFALSGLYGTYDQRVIDAFLQDLPALARLMPTPRTNDLVMPSPRMNYLVYADPVKVDATIDARMAAGTTTPEQARNLVALKEEIEVRRQWQRSKKKVAP